MRRASIIAGGLSVGLLVMAGCTAPIRTGDLPRMGESLKLAGAAVTVQAAATPSPTPAPSADPLAGLPTTEAPLAGISRSPDPSTTKTYEAADFTFQYVETWEPDLILASDAAKGQVLKLSCTYANAGVAAWGAPASGTIGKYLAETETALSRTKTSTTRVTLDGKPGFQVEADAFADGKKYYQSTAGFIVDGRLIALTVFYDPASKDKDYLESELATILSTWKWRHLG
jgi:hypothetical protein